MSERGKNRKVAENATERKGVFHISSDDVKVCGRCGTLYVTEISKARILERSASRNENPAELIKNDGFCPVCFNNNYIMKSHNKLVEAVNNISEVLFGKPST